MANKKNMVEDSVKDTVEVIQKYGKEQIVSAKRYFGKQDLLHAVLRDDQMYSLEQVDELIEKFMKGKVN